MIALQTFLRTAESLGDLSRARADALRHMIADLMETGNFRNRGDAVRQLHGDGYPTIDIMILVGEAIYACQQEVIAREMSDEDVNHRTTDVDAASNGHPGFGGSAS